MRENRTCDSEGGEAQSLPYPYPGQTLTSKKERVPRRCCSSSAICCSVSVSMLVGTWVVEACLGYRVRALSQRQPLCYFLAFNLSHSLAAFASRV